MLYISTETDVVALVIEIGPVFVIFAMAELWVCLFYHHAQLQKHFFHDKHHLKVERSEFILIIMFTSATIHLFYLMYQRSYLGYKLKGEHDFNNISSLLIILTRVKSHKSLRRRREKVHFPDNLKLMLDYIKWFTCRFPSSCMNKVPLCRQRWKTVYNSSKLIFNK